MVDLGPGQKAYSEHGGVAWLRVGGWGEVGGGVRDEANKPPLCQLFACNYPLKHLKVRPQKTRPREIYHFPRWHMQEPTLRRAWPRPPCRTPKLQRSTMLPAKNYQWPPITISLTHTIINPTHFQYLSSHILVVFVNNSGWICMCPNWGGKLPSLEVLSHQVSSFHLLLFPLLHQQCTCMNWSVTLHCICCSHSILLFVPVYMSIFNFTPVYMHSSVHVWTRWQLYIVRTCCFHSSEQHIGVRINVHIALCFHRDVDKYRTVFLFLHFRALWSCVSISPSTLVLCFYFCTRLFSGPVLSFSSQLSCPSPLSVK